MNEKIEVLICYAHEDESLRQSLEKHLQVLQRQNLITVWHDRKIRPGTDWEQEMDVVLNHAHIILLLVSPDFMASDYCYGKEMVRAMERHERKQTQVIPIILRPVYWQAAPFGKIQVLPKDALPVTRWEDQDDAFFNITEEIRAIVEYENERRNDLDNIIASGQTLQLDCMLLEYGMNILRKRFGIEADGNWSMLRERLKEDEVENEQVFSSEEIAASYDRTGFYQKMYSQLSDAALVVNEIYFPMPPRPQGSAFSCAEQVCRESALNVVRKYFPSFEEAIKQLGVTRIDDITP